jgi:HEAT repeat protein
VLKAAAKALGELKDARAIDPLIAAFRQDNDLIMRTYLENALVNIGAPAVEPLISAIKDSNRNVRKASIQTLAKLKDARAIEPLIAALKDNDMEVRKDTAQMLGYLKDTRAIEPLATILKESGSDMRRIAIAALVRINDGRAVEPLINALNDTDLIVRCDAIKALETIGDMRAVEPLITILLKDRNDTVRMNAVWTLGKLGDVRAVVPLSAALKDSDSDVRKAAASALDTIRRQPGKDEPQSSQGTHGWIRQGKTLMEIANEKQARMEAQFGKKINYEALITYYELIQNNEPGIFTMYAIDRKAYIIAKMQPPPSLVADIFKSNIQSGNVIFVSSCHIYPTYPMTYLRIFVPLDAGSLENVKGAIIESPTDFTNANFQEWVSTLEAAKKTMLLVYDEKGNILVEGNINIKEEIINKVVHTVDQANIALVAIPKEQRDFHSASQAFFRDHPNPFI